MPSPTWSPLSLLWHPLGASSEVATTGNTDPDDFSLPWDNRTRVFPQSTYCGRVVYHRPKHFFSADDVDRVAASVKILVPTERHEGVIERLIRLVFKIIFAIAPIPGILTYLENPFINFYVGVMYDLKQYYDQAAAFRRRTRTFLDEVIQAYSSEAGIELIIKEADRLRG